MRTAAPIRALVTGGAGYVGSACLRWLLAHGHEAWAYDNLSLGHPEAVPAGRLVTGDIFDTAALAGAMKDRGCDALMHFAGSTMVGESVENPALYWRNNVAGTLSVLEAMRGAGVRRMLFSSTCATYGLTPAFPMTEDAPQDPCNPYAMTKWAVEKMIADFGAAYDIGYTLLRYFNAAGASDGGAHGEDHTPETHLIPLILQYAQGRRAELKVFGDDYPTPDGTCIRDYVHVDDLAQAHLLAIGAVSPGSRDVFNIGTGTGSSVLEVIRACERVVGKSLAFSVVARRPGDAPRLVASPDRLRARLGWDPRYTDIGAVAASAWEWHRGHPDGYASSTARARQSA